MIVDFERHTVGRSPSRATLWRGRTGSLHALLAERIDNFALNASTLHMVASGPVVLWVGSAADLVADAASRARFRLALSCGDRVFAVDAPADEVARATLIWDLEGAEPSGALSAA